MRTIRYTSLLLVGLFFFPFFSIRAQSKADCLACHSDSSLTTERDGKTISLFFNETAFDHSPHKNLVCVACHAGFKPDEMPHKEHITPVNCLTCHRDAPIEHKFHPKLAQLKGNVADNDAQPELSCKYCHGTHDIVSPKISTSRTNEANVATLCSECHGDVIDAYDSSAHGKARASGITSAPTCLTCHRQAIVGNDVNHDTLSVKVAQVKLCLSCHLDDPNVRSRTSPTAGFIAEYEQSVHGSNLLKGNFHAANCVDCHGNHQMRKSVDPQALTNKTNIPSTCGKCHADIEKQYEQSVHGKAVARGNQDAPVCTDCHGEHNIYQHSDPRSPVAATNLAAQVCSKCHGSVQLSEKYGIASDRVTTFSDSYHGLAIRAGSASVANCASCHTAHDIKPSSDSTSSVNKANLAATCGKCHPGVTTRFASGSVHLALAQQQEPTLYWLTTGYVLLIVLTIGGMLIHNLLDFISRSRRKLKIRRGALVSEYSEESGLYLRMTLNERLQHGSLFTSFFLLVVTGFMLRYPEAWWVVEIRDLSNRVFDLRGIIHRIAAVVMISAGIWHIVYLIKTERGRQLFRDLMPTLKDAQDVKMVFRYYLGVSRVKPKFDRFSYIEKSEYWALVWGTGVMGITGIIMWFDNTFISLISKYGYDISRTIHFYEAWLAMLAIIVWHFYAVIFNPDVYPNNVAWFKGTLTRGEMEEEHPLELERILAKEAEEKASKERDNAASTPPGKSTATETSQHPTGSGDGQSAKDKEGKPK